MAKSTAFNTPTINRRYARFRLRVRRSQIHRWGVCAGEAIPPRRKVLEYTGEKINRSEIDDPTVQLEEPCWGELK